ncbi:MAG: restriction endonuclease subunit S [Phreatobacter sp.]|nr:restriction endonuclease subunit S [Phreatobacter sp.]
MNDTPSGWRWRKLTDVAQLESGHTPSRARGDWWNGDVSWVSLTEIRALDGKWVESTKIRTNSAGIANSAARILPRGTVCFSRTASVGFVTIMAEPMATSQDFANWVCGDDLDPEFLMYALIRARAELKDLAFGATHKTIYMPTLEAFHICLPLRPDQCRIAARLKAQLAQVEAARQAAESQARDSMLLRQRMLRDVFAALEDAPLKELGGHAPTTSGTTPSRGSRRYWEPGEIPWVKTGEIAFAPIHRTEESISRVALAECSLTLLPRRTVLMAMYGQGKTRGQSAVLEIPAATNQACFAILPNETWDSDFLFYWFMAKYQELRNLSDDRGGNQANLNGALLKALEVPAPDRQEQLKVVRRIKAALVELELLETASKAVLSDLRRLPQTLFVQAFGN